MNSFLSGKRILVTGACGTIAKVEETDISSQSSFSSPVELVTGDIREYDKFIKASYDIDVLHAHQNKF